MQKSILLVVLVLMAGVAQAGEGITFFQGTWKEAMAKAAEEDKLLFVDAYAKWCGPCKRMAKQVFTQPEVGDFFNENFINLKLDMEETDGRTFGSQYPVSAYPTLFFLDGKGEIIKKIRGGQKAAGLIQHGKLALKGYDRSGNYEQAYQDGDRSYDLVYNYVVALAKAGKPHLKIANEYLRSKPDITAEQRAKFVFDAATDMDSRIFEEVLDSKDLILKSKSTADWDQKIRRACLAAVDKSIEYDYPDLKTQAIETGAKYLNDGGKAFVFETGMHEALLLKDADNYASNAKSFAKKNKYDIDIMMSSINVINSHFDANKSAVKVAADFAKKIIKADKVKYNMVPTFGKLLVLADERKTALKMIEKIKKENEGDSMKTNKMDGLLKYINETPAL